jgi:hypothetical protein
MKNLSLGAIATIGAVAGIVTAHAPVLAIGWPPILSLFGL